jgi:hypothetical protein
VLFTDYSSQSGSPNKNIFKKHTNPTLEILFLCFSTFQKLPEILPASFLTVNEVIIDFQHIPCKSSLGKNIETCFFKCFHAIGTKIVLAIGIPKPPIRTIFLFLWENWIHSIKRINL